MYIFSKRAGKDNFSAIVSASDKAYLLPIIWYSPPAASSVGLMKCSFIDAGVMMTGLWAIVFEDTFQFHFYTYNLLLSVRLMSES